MYIYKHTNVPVLLLKANSKSEIIVFQIVNQDDENDCRDSEEMESIGRKLMGINENLECIAQVCPDLLRRGSKTIYGILHGKNNPKMINRC